MLILVAVTVRTAVTSNLFTHAKNAVQGWENAQKAELELANNLDEYLSNTNSNGDNNTNNNQSTIEISDITPSIVKAKEGDTVTWSVTIRNTGNADAVCSIKNSLLDSVSNNTLEIKKGETKTIQHTYFVQEKDSGKQLIYSIEILDTLLETPEVVSKESLPVQVLYKVIYTDRS